MIEKRTTWGPVQWDGSLEHLAAVVRRFRLAGAPPEAKVSLGPVSYAGAQLTARMEEEMAEG